MIIEAFPEGAEQPYDDRYLPLHIHCEENKQELTDETAHLLIEAFPEVLRIEGNYGKLALHCCESQSTAVVRVVLEAFPEGAEQPDDDGYLPLRIHCEENKQDPTGEIAQLLIETYPEALRIEGKYGRLPLH